MFVEQLLISLPALICLGSIVAWLVLRVMGIKVELYGPSATKSILWRSIALLGLLLVTLYMVVALNG